MIVLIPAYQPDARLVALVRSLADVVVVDDGSGPGYAPVFDAVRELGATVLTLKANRGKGFALKAGFAHIREHHPGRDVVCADSDGQHAPADILAVAARVGDGAMVLGVRRFTGPVPARSRYGNAVTRGAFLVATGRLLTDTQTGLRGYPASMLGWLGEVPGDRFEYELRLLLRAVRSGLPIEEVDIATIYLDRNASSHFRPLRDSARIYVPLVAFSASSLLGFVVDAAALLAFVALGGGLVASAVAARLVSASVNYSVNRAVVFRARGSLLRYAALAAVLLSANVVLLRGFAALTGSLLVAKVGTELLLFAVSFCAQRLFVFQKRGTERAQQTQSLGRLNEQVTNSR